ncbi:hypothetical protein [Xanthomonas axonopodis]
MYHLFGDEVVTSLLLRRAGALNAQRLDDRTAVAGFNQFLQAHSIIEVAIDWVGPRLVDFEGLKPYAPRFAEQKKRFFAENSSLLRERLANGYFGRALQTLSDKAPRLCQMANFCVRLIVVNQLSEYTNGTTEDTIGVANFNFKDDFDELDFHELLVHQLVHMLLFVDDTLDPHMAQDRKDVQVKTGLPFVMGGTCFPIYLAFHSYIVAVEMLLYREATGQLDACPVYHRSTARVIRIIHALGQAMRTNCAMFDARGRDILDRAFVRAEAAVGRVQAAAAYAPA